MSNFGEIRSNGELIFRDSPSEKEYRKWNEESLLGRKNLTKQEIQLEKDNEIIDWAREELNEEAVLSFYRFPVANGKSELQVGYSLKFERPILKLEQLFKWKLPALGITTRLKQNELPENVSQNLSGVNFGKKTKFVLVFEDHIMKKLTSDPNLTNDNWTSVDTNLPNTKTLHEFLTYIFDQLRETSHRRGELGTYDWIVKSSKDNKLRSFGRGARRYLKKTFQL